jgi:hypothetical protein
LYNMTFSDLIETVKCLSVEEKEELQLLLKQYLREERREEMSQNFELSQTEEQQGKLKYSANIDELKRSIED